MLDERIKLRLDLRDALELDLQLSKRLLDLSTQYRELLSLLRARRSSTVDSVLILGIQDLKLTAEMKVPPLAEESMAMMALSFIDLRAQYQAALRRLESAENCLLKCQEPQESSAFAKSVSALRDEVAILSTTNRSVCDVLDQVVRDVDHLEPESSRT